MKNIFLPILANIGPVLVQYRVLKRNRKNSRMNNRTLFDFQYLREHQLYLLNVVEMTSDRGRSQEFEKGGGQDPDRIGAPPIHFGAPPIRPPPMKRHPLFTFWRPSSSPLFPYFPNFPPFSSFCPLFPDFCQCFSFFPFFGAPSPFLAPPSLFFRHPPLN